MLIGLVVLAAVAFEQSWIVVRHLMVMAHEGAHAVLASLLFRGVSGITLNQDGTGLTEFGGGGNLGTVLIKFVGYIGPSVVGLSAAKLIASGHSVATLWVALFLLAILLLALRMSFGIVTVIPSGALVFFVARFAPVQTQEVTAYAITWLLLLSGVRVIIQHGLGSGDGSDLRKLTGIPHLLWSVLWLAGALWAVAVGGRMLVMRT